MALILSIELSLGGCVLSPQLTTPKENTPETPAVQTWAPTEGQEVDDSSQEGPAEKEQDGAESDEGSGSEEGTHDDEPTDRVPARPASPVNLPAGSVLRAEDIQRMGGVGAFFWSIEIPDEVFARMEGKSFGSDCTVPRSDLRYLHVLHVDAQGSTLVGELVVNRRVADEVVDIFRQLYEAAYPIHKMHLVDDYDASDDLSCADDNTSSFNFRRIAGTNTISNHAYGLAIDISPFENPYCIPSTGYVSPRAAERFSDRTLREPYMIHTDDLCYQLFTSHGWSWGGNWDTDKDYQHFEKPEALWE